MSTLHPVVVHTEEARPLSPVYAATYADWSAQALAELTGRTFDNIAAPYGLAAPDGMFSPLYKPNALVVQTVLRARLPDVDADGNFWMAFVPGTSNGGTGAPKDFRWNEPPLGGFCAVSGQQLQPVGVADGRRGAWASEDPERIEWLRRVVIRVGVHELLHTFGLTHEFPDRDPETPTLWDDPKGPFRNHTASNYMETVVWAARAYEENDQAHGGLFDQQREIIQRSTVLPPWPPVPEEDEGPPLINPADEAYNDIVEGAERLRALVD